MRTDRASKVTPSLPKLGFDSVERARGIASHMGTDQATRGKIGGSNKMITMAEAAVMVGMSYSRFARHYKRDWRIPCYRVGGRVNFRERDIEAYPERNRETA